MHNSSLVWLLGFLAACTPDADDDGADTSSEPDGTTGDNGTGSDSMMPTSDSTPTTEGETTATTATDTDTDTDSGTDGECREPPDLDDVCGAYADALVACGWSEGDAYAEEIVCLDTKYYDDTSAFTDYYACLSTLSCDELMAPMSSPCACHDPQA